MAARAKRSAAEWRQIVAECRASGMARTRFAQERGLRPATLAWWVAHFNREARGAGRGKGFVEVQVAEEPGRDEAFRIEVAGTRHVVVVPRGFDAAEVRRLVQALC